MRSLVASVLCAAVCLGHVARADDTERVDTRDGSSYRGELVERVAGDHVTLKLATGELKRIEWADIVAPVAPPPPPPPTAKAPRPKSGITVDLVANDERARLERYTGTGTVDVDHVTTTGITLYTTQRDIDVYSDVCGVPCTVRVDPAARYRIGGEGLIPTDGFSLRSGQDNRIEAVLATKAKRTTGKVLTYLGIPITVLGALFLTLGAISSDQAPCDGCVRMKSTFLLWGGIVAGVGVPVLTIGIVLWATATSSASIDGEKVSIKLPGGLALSPGGLSF